MRYIVSICVQCVLRGKSLSDIDGSESFLFESHILYRFSQLFQAPESSLYRKFTIGRLTHADGARTHAGDGDQESMVETPMVVSSSTSSSTLTVSSAVSMVTLFSLAQRRMATPSS